MAEPLSPAAQSMLAAYGSFTGGLEAVMPSERRGLAAAICALVDQTVPACSSRTDRGAQRCRIRAEILAIAAELKGGANSTTPQEAQ